MAFVHGTQLTFTADSTALTSYTASVSFTKNGETIDVTAAGDDDRAFIAGLRNAQIQFNGHFDAVADAAWEAMFDLASVAWSWSPDGGTTTYSGNGFATTYNVNAPVGGKVSISGTIQATGAVTRA